VNSTPDDEKTQQTETLTRGKELEVVLYFHMK
jgi:hypothetical protein